MKQIHKVSSEVSKGLLGVLWGAVEIPSSAFAPYSLFSEPSPRGSFFPPTTRCVWD